MYMRYYPKQLKTINRLDFTQEDRGKRHYWGYEKGDYGFYQSHELQEMKNLSKARRLHRHHRNHTVDSSFVQQKPYHSDNKNMNTERRNLHNISNPEDIHLPSISRISRETQTQKFNVGNSKKNDNYQQQKQQSYGKSDKKQLRIETEPSYNKYQSKYQHYIQFDQRTRFSPTFVCSIRNPLPSYTIQPQIYRSPQYIQYQRKREIR